jgi:hypothetical protein
VLIRLRHPRAADFFEKAEEPMLYSSVANGSRRIVLLGLHRSGDRAAICVELTALFMSSCFIAESGYFSAGG